MEKVCPAAADVFGYSVVGRFQHIENPDYFRFLLGVKPRWRATSDAFHYQWNVFVIGTELDSIRKILVAFV